MTQPQHRAIVKYGILPYLMGFIRKDNGKSPIPGAQLPNVETFKVSMISRRMHNMVNEMIGISFAREGAKYHQLENFVGVLYTKPHEVEEEVKLSSSAVNEDKKHLSNLTREVSIDTLWRNPVFGGSFLDPVGGKGPSSRPNSIMNQLVAGARSKDG